MSRETLANRLLRLSLLLLAVAWVCAAIAAVMNGSFVLSAVAAGLVIGFLLVRRLVPAG